MFKYDKKHHLAELSNDPNGPLVSTLLQKPGSKWPTIIAYALAKLSRNPLNKPMREILEEVLPNEQSSTNKMEQIVGGYGHTSVTGMGHLACTFENVSIYEALRYFYNCRLQDSQETSTRYVDFTNGDTLTNFTPPDPRLPSNATEQYYKILEKQIGDYRRLLIPTQKYLQKKYQINTSNKQEVAALKARSFDCLRYLIPLATRTRFGGVQPAREWAKYIKLSLASENPTEVQVGELLKSLLTVPRGDYTPEADILIRHTDPITNCIRDLMELVEVKQIGNPIKGEAIVKHIMEEIEYGLTTRVGKLKLPNYFSLMTNVKLEKFNEVLFAEHSHHNEMGPLFQEGLDTVVGAIDIGSLKDINRHRSLELFVPFLHEEAQVADAISSTSVRDQFLICPYIDPNDNIHWEYKTALIETYELLQDWAGRVRPQDTQAREITLRKLVPQAHLVQYEVSGSLADWSYALQLRVRNGGHIAYRLWAFEVAKVLAKYNPIYQGLVNKLKQQEPDMYSKAQFLDRS